MKVEERLEAIKLRAASIVSMIQEFDAIADDLTTDLLDYIETDSEAIAKDIQDLCDLLIEDPDP